ncbi:taste receptor type 2 member 40-like [Dendropsophus ebraccatus]|uniref:taste receptor type 2 member 40-like n=1 Tax=Dendropsophus ebraccatus TaxID=150705 RepID=UPI0038315DF3
MLPVFILVSMIVLAASTVMAVLTNSFIIAVNLMDRATSKSLSPSDVIVVTLCVSNIFFQLVMIFNDYMSFVCADIYFTYYVYIVSNSLLMLPIYCSFWFTVCLSLNYYLQIVIATHPFLIRLKLAAAQLVPWLIMASIIISVATGIPAYWNFQSDPLNVNMSTNASAEVSFIDLNAAYPLPSILISCSIPLALVGFTNSLIIKSLVSRTHISDKNAKGELSARAEGRARAARTISRLLFLYTSFYVSEVFLFTNIFDYKSPGFCVCLFVIYGYSPAQSIVLIFGSPKLKQASLSLFHCVGGTSKEKPKTPTVLFIKLRKKKTVNLPAN